MTGHTSLDRTMEKLRNHNNSSSSLKGYNIPHLPSYDGFYEYNNWEIQMYKVFAQYYLCDRRKIKIATSVLKEYALL